MKPLHALLALLCVAACSDYPRDTEDTLARVGRDGMVVGWVGGSIGGDRLEDLVDALEAASGGEAAIVHGAAEPLLLELEAGRVDVVVGTFDAATPWDVRVSFSRPLFDIANGDTRLEGKAAVRNGEHAWAMAIDRAVSRARERRG